jgi:DNA primase
VPGVDFDRLRAEVPIEQVLQLLGFEPERRRGGQWSGHCPLPACRQSRRASFSVNVARGRYCCHRCESHGHQLELWSALTGLPLYAAAIHLCHTLGREVPWIHRW